MDSSLLERRRKVSLSAEQTSFIESLLPRLPRSLAFVPIDVIIAGLNEDVSPDCFQSRLPPTAWERVGFIWHNKLLYLSPRRSTGDLISPPFSPRDLLSMCRRIVNVSLFSPCLHCLLRFCYLPPPSLQLLPDHVSSVIDVEGTTLADMMVFINSTFLPTLSTHYPDILNADYLSSYFENSPLPPTNGGSSPVQTRQSKRANMSSAASSTSSFPSSLLSSGPGPPSSGPPRSSRSASSLGSGGSDVPPPPSVDPPSLLSVAGFFLHLAACGILAPVNFLFDPDDDDWKAIMSHERLLVWPTASSPVDDMETFSPPSSPLASTLLNGAPVLQMSNLAPVLPPLFSFLGPSSSLPAALVALLERTLIKVSAPNSKGKSKLTCKEVCSGWPSELLFTFCGRGLDGKIVTKNPSVPNVEEEEFNALLENLSSKYTSCVFNRQRLGESIKKWKTDFIHPLLRHKVPLEDAITSWFPSTSLTSYFDAEEVVEEVPVSTVVTVKHRFWEDPGIRDRFSDHFIAIVRHLKCQCCISGNQIRHVLALTYFMFTGLPPPSECLISRSTLSTGISRISARDFSILQSVIREGGPYDFVCICADDTDFKGDQKHVIHATMWNEETSTPNFMFVTCRAATGKADEQTAGEDLEALLNQLGVPPGRVRGANTDHHAKGEIAKVASHIKRLVPPTTFELKELNVAINAAESAPASNVAAKAHLALLRDGEKDKILSGNLNPDRVFELQKIFKLRRHVPSFTHPNDPFHKLNLLVELCSSEIFGENPMRAGSAHHVQTLYDMHWIVTKSTRNFVAILDKLMGCKGFWSKVPPKPVSQRWLYIMQAAQHFMDMCEERLPLPLVGYLFPQGFEEIARRGTPTVKEAATRFATRGRDLRIKIGVIFELEFGLKFQQPEMAFYRSKSNLGFDVGFRCFDIKEHFEKHTKVWWDKSDNFKTILPRTHAAVEALEDPNVRADFHKMIQQGMNKGRVKFNELFKFMDEIDFWFFDITARGRSGSCWRAATSALRQLVSASAAFFPIDKFEPYDVDIPLDNTLFERFSTDIFKLHDSFISLGFYDDEILADIAAMTKNKIVDPDSDMTTDDFARGVSDYTHLFDRCRRTIGAMPSTNVMNELTFSQMKALHEHGQSDEALDQHLAYRQNIVHHLNLKRRDLNKHRKDSSKAADSPQQLLMDIEQLTETVLPRYTIRNMADTPARSTFRGFLTQKTKDNAARFLAREQTSLTTNEDFEKMYQEALSVPTHGQQRHAIISAVTNSQRLLAVIHEEIVPGQEDNKRTFWTNLTAANLIKEMKFVSPWLHHLNSFITKKENGKALNYPKKRSTTQRAAWVRQWIVVMRKHQVCAFLDKDDDKSNFLFLFGLNTKMKESAIYTVAAERKGSAL